MEAPPDLFAHFKILYKNILVGMLTPDRILNDFLNFHLFNGESISHIKDCKN